jgi:hypothetical protein
MASLMVIVGNLIFQDQLPKQFQSKFQFFVCSFANVFIFAPFSITIISKTFEIKLAPNKTNFEIDLLMILVVTPLI